MENVAVIFGGQSTEHDISIVTALANVIKPLELTHKYRVEAVYISKQGKWYCDERLKDIGLFSSGGINAFLGNANPVGMHLGNGLTLSKASGLAGRKQYKSIDIVFPALHGTKGEDGSLMGLLELANIPYVGCGLSSSVIAMDKVFAKQLAVSAGIPTARFTFTTKYELEQDPRSIVRSIEKQLQYPLFVKPAHLGSSIGINQAANTAELLNALEVAAHYDQKVIIEEAVENLIEVTLPIMGNAVPTPALLERPLTTAEDFFSFERKYLNGGKKGVKGGDKGTQGYSEIPAHLPGKLAEEAIAIGTAVYKILGCTGIARVDMLIDEKKKQVYFNEVNPLPGGLYAHNWRATGMSNISLVEQLIELAKQRHEEQRAVTNIFNTNYLQQF